MKKKNTFVFCVFIICLSVFLSSFINPAPAHAGGPNKDYILVLDTSLSMVGYGGKNIFNDVKGSLSRFVDKLEEGDSITFMTFDTKVRVWPVVYIREQNSKDILKKYISMMEAAGKWTYTLDMIRTVLGTAAKLEKKEDDRQVVIVIMSDGLDDPPPHLRKDRLKLGAILDEHKGTDWFIYLVNFGDLTKKIVKLQDELRNKVSPHTQRIDAEKDPTKGIEESKEDVETKLAEKQLRERSFWGNPIFISLIVIALIIVILIYLKTLAKLKVTGQLEFWNHELLDPYVASFNLTRHNARELAVGKGAGSNLHIRDLEIQNPFVIAAKKVKGKIHIALIAGEGYSINYVNRDAGEFLQDGDMFKINNYTFKFNAE